MGDIEQLAGFFNSEIDAERWLRHRSVEYMSLRLEKLRARRKWPTPSFCSCGRATGWLSLTSVGCTRRDARMPANP
jgi:hypothetical protein